MVGVRRKVQQEPFATRSEVPGTATAPILINPKTANHHSTILPVWIMTLYCDRAALSVNDRSEMETTFVRTCLLF